MADKSAQDALYEHYGDMELRVVDEPGDGGPGMSGEEAGVFLRSLRPMARVRQSLAAAAAKVAKLGG